MIGRSGGQHDGSTIARRDTCMSRSGDSVTPSLPTSSPALSSLVSDKYSCPRRTAVVFWSSLDVGRRDDRPASLVRVGCVARDGISCCLGTAYGGAGWMRSTRTLLTRQRSQRSHPRMCEQRQWRHARGKPRKPAVRAVPGWTKKHRWNLCPRRDARVRRGMS